MKSIGIGLGAATVLGVNTLEIGTDAAKRIVDAQASMAEAEECAVDLPVGTISESRLPVSCYPFSTKFRIASEQIMWEDNGRPTVYILPERQGFLEERAASLKRQEQNAERAAQAGSLAVAIGGLALTYYFARGPEADD